MDTSVTQEEVLSTSIELSAAEKITVARHAMSFAHLFCPSTSSYRLLILHEGPVSGEDSKPFFTSRYPFATDAKELSDVKVQSRLRKFTQMTVSGIVAVLVIVYLGMQYEQHQMQKLPSTEHLYKTPRVCGLSHDGSDIRMSTFASAAQMEQDPGRKSNASTVVAHCGDCGKCSNPYDINIYDQTKTTLYKDSLVCAQHSLLGGYEAASRCMSERVGLSNDCNECWVENIMCDRRQCVFSCLWESIASRGIHGGSANERLNRCTQCDEVRCGPAFLQCAGANRRRTAIKSDIVRDTQVEVCSSVQPKWWLNRDIQAAWQQTYGENATHQEQQKERPTGIRGTRTADYAHRWP